MIRISDIRNNTRGAYMDGPITQDEGERIIRELFDDWEKKQKLHYSPKVRVAAIMREWLFSLTQMDEHEAYIILMACIAYALGYEPEWEHSCQIDFFKLTAKKEIDFNCSRQRSKSRQPDKFESSESQEMSDESSFVDDEEFPF